jgi:hypothetical protein
MAQPNRKGAYNGENVDGYVWSNLTMDWINLSSLSGLSTLSAFNTPIKIDTNAIIQNMQNSDFGKNMAEFSKGLAKLDGMVVGDGGSQSATIGSFFPIQNSGPFQISDPDRVDYGQDARIQGSGINNDGRQNLGNPVIGDVFENEDTDIYFPPFDYGFVLTWNSSPNVPGMVVSNSGSTRRDWSTKDFIASKTFKAKGGGYGESVDVYRVQRKERTEARFGSRGVQAGYIVEIFKNGALVDTITTAKKSFIGTFGFKALPKEDIIPPKVGVNVSCDITAPNGISAVVQVGNQKETSNNGENLVVRDSSASSANLNVNLSGTDSLCNYTYELVDAGGRLIQTTSDKNFTKNNLAAGVYTLKIVVSKTSVPPLPDPSPSYRYRRETYYVDDTKTVGSVASGPRAVKTEANIVNGDTVLYFGDGQNNGDNIQIEYSSTNADYVRYTIGTSETKLSTSGVVEISEFDLYKGNGTYTLYFQAVSRTDGSGNIVPVKFTAVRKDLLPGPDIRTIEYPQLITGKDYQGYNVDFEISWTSINTNYVDIWINEIGDKTKLASKRPADGVQSFNIKDVLRKAGNSLDEDTDAVTFTLKLIPYNEEGDEKTAGKTETVQIQFDKGNIKLRRDIVLSDIKESICNLFDTSILNGDNSKYLTHLMHFGNANNKIIASWDIDYETFSEYQFDEQTGERSKVPGTEEKSLVFKLYEPLPREVQPNEQIWVSKIQSIPYVEQVTIINEEFEDCVELSPNFGTTICGGENIGFQLYDDLIASGSSSSTKLLTEYVSGSGFDLKKLDINFVSSSREVSGSIFIDGESTYAWNNFVKYSSAGERVNNFVYKIKLMEFYEDKINKLESGSFYTGSVTLKNEINRNSQSIQEVKDNFDAFETFLFTSSSIDGLTYPGAGGTMVSASDSTEAQTWINTIGLSAQNYDFYNKDYLINNLPLHVQNSEDSEQFKMFFNMMGHHFDVLYSYTKAIAKKKNLEHKYDIGIKDSLLSQMLQSLGWDTKVPAKAQSLWEYAFGETEDGTSTSSMTGKQMQNQIWRRLLNNLPYLLKHKGSSRALKAALSCYGIPSSMLTIMEFGGPRNTDGGTTKFSFEDRTAALNISGSQSVIVPWKQYSETSDYPNAVELRISSDIRQDQTFVTSSLWSVGVEHFSGNQAKLKLTVADSTNHYSVTSSAFPFYNDEYTQVIVQKSNNTFTVFGKEAFQGRIRSEVSASIEVENHIWQTPTSLQIGGVNMTGSIDEFRYWTTPLSESRMDNHTLMPDAIDGNHHSSSTEDLIYRLDFEYPKDRNADTAIKNVSINERYVEPFATASGFDSITEYPYHYTPYERTVTANVPSSGFNVSQKFRFEEQQGLNEDIEYGLTLSYRERSTKKSFDTSPIDSNRLGLFFSPIKEINMDILKSIGQFELDDYIGNPSDEYEYEYRDLRVLRNYYFERYSLNLYEYIQLVRYIDQSLFEVLESLVPARAIVSSGLLIEPHILERNKVKRTKPQAVDFGSKFQDGEIDAREAYQLAMIPITQWPADLKLQEQVRLAGLQNQYDSFIQNINPNFQGTFQNLIGSLRDLSPTFVSTYDLIDGTITDSKVVDKILRQFEAFGAQDQVGLDTDSIANGLAGITAQNGFAYITKLDGQGNLIKEHKQVFLVTETFTIKEPIQINPDDASLGTELQDVTKTKKYIVFADIGDNGPQVGQSGKFGGTITSVERVNSNGGKIRGTGTLGEKYGKRSFKNRSIQTSRTTLDGKSPIETFCTNPNILKVSDAGRGSGEPILEVDVK